MKHTNEMFIITLAATLVASIWAFADIAKSGQADTPAATATEISGECATCQQPAVTVSADELKQIRELLAQKAPQQAAAAPLTEEEKAAKAKKDEDEEYDRLSCKGTKDRVELAECFVDNLEKINEKIDKLPSGVLRGKYQNLRDSARGKIANGAAQAMIDRENLRRQHGVISSADQDRIDELTEKIDDLKDKSSDVDDKNLNQRIASVERAVSQGFSAQSQWSPVQDRINDIYSSQMMTLAQNIRTARLNNDFLSEERFRQMYLNYSNQSKDDMKLLEQLDPSRQLTDVARATGASSLSYFNESYTKAYNDLRDVVRNNAQQLSLLNFMTGNNTANSSGLSGANGQYAIRQSRNPGFSLITTMPDYGSPYGTSVIQDSLGNDGLGAANFMTQNGNSLLPRQRGNI